MNDEKVDLPPEIADRKSVTYWNARKCSEQTWELLIEAARRAPSSWNHQPARYVIIEEKEDIHRLSSAFHRINGWARKAAGLIVQTANPDDDDRIAGQDYYLYDCGLAMMSLVYQAQWMGLTSRQMIGWDEAEVKQILRIPDPYRVVVITAIGYPASSLIGSFQADAKRRISQQHKRNQTEHIAFRRTWQGSGQNDQH